MQTPSERSRSVRHFLVMEILERAHELQARGIDIVHMEVGEPDFDTPHRASDAGIEAIRSGRTHYTHSLGIPQLREALALRIAKDYGVEVSPGRIVVTMGSSSGLQLALAALLDPGDDVIVSDPGYACYPNIARALGGVPNPVAVDAAASFAYDAADVERAIGPRTRGIIVNSPSNPTGTLTPPDVFTALCELGLPIISDEIYHGLVYEGEARSALEFTDEAFVVGGFSKRYAMTGWRLGYLVVPESHLRAVQAMQQNLFISASDFGQFAALAALETDDDIEHMRARFDERRRYLLDALPAAGLPVPSRPQGAFYVFADASEHTGDSHEFAVELLEKARVAVAPGIDFGARGEGFLRFSYATAMDRLSEGIGRIGDYLRQRR